MNEEARIRQAVEHVRIMLDKRGMGGTDVDIPSVHDCPCFMRGMLRMTESGDSMAVFVIRNINKGSINALFSYCQPPDPEETGSGDDEPEPHPHAGNNIRNAIVVYLEKCTTMAGREIDGCMHINVERFKLEEILRFPLIFGLLGKCRVMKDAEVAVLTERIALDKLPKIWSSDPLQRYFNAKVGQVYEIEERYGSLQPEIKHRVVMEQSC